jgi:hypothetical protein
MKKKKTCGLYNKIRAALTVTHGIRAHFHFHLKIVIFFILIVYYFYNQEEKKPQQML